MFHSLARKDGGGGRRCSWTGLAAGGVAAMLASKLLYMIRVDKVEGR